MRRIFLIAVSVASLLLLPACSPRDFLTRRLAADLVAGSIPFKTPQHFVLRIGLLSNKDYVSPEYLVFQRHGWISATNAACPAPSVPSPCWEVVLSPSGVDSIRGLIAPEERNRSSFSIPVAKRELLTITGIAKQDNVADVEFTWRWVPLNEFGSAIYSSDLRYRAVVQFRYFDDGWRLTQGTPSVGQSLEEALKSSELTQ